MLPYVMYRTLGPQLGEGRAATAPIWGLCQMYAMNHGQEAARAGYTGSDAGNQLFQALLDADTAVTIGISTCEESFARIPFADNKLQMVIRELLEEVDELDRLQPLMDTTADYPFALVAGSVSDS